MKKDKLNKSILNIRREQYCRNVASGYSGIESAKRAGYAHSCANKTSDRLLGIKAVRDRIETLAAPSINLFITRQLEIMNKAVKVALGEEELPTPGSVTIMSKMLDKILSSKTENKSEVSHIFNINFDV